MNKEFITHLLMGQRIAVFLVFLLGTQFSLISYAKNLVEISELYAQGKPRQAMVAIEEFRHQNPLDINGRFVYGILLSKTGKMREAVGVVSSLLDDHPGLPEAYNNLAMIYLQQKQYKVAKELLEAAIHKSPNYAVAFGNLDYVYAVLAGKASTSAAEPKLLRFDLVSASGYSKEAILKKLAVNSVSSLSGISESTTSKQTGVVASLPLESVEGITASAEEAVPVVNDSALVAVQEAVEQWVSAWARKDIQAYLSAYSAEFKPASGKSRKSWERERVKRISHRGQIDISVEEPSVTFDGRKACVVFLQHYQSATLTERQQKRLILVQEAGKWLVIREELIGVQR